MQLNTTEMIQQQCRTFCGWSSANDLTSSELVLDMWLVTGVLARVVQELHQRSGHRCWGSKTSPKRGGWREGKKEIEGEEGGKKEKSDADMAAIVQKKQIKT